MTLTKPPSKSNNSSTAQPNPLDEARKYAKYALTTTGVGGAVGFMDGMILGDTFTPTDASGLDALLVLGPILLSGVIGSILGGRLYTTLQKRFEERIPSERAIHVFSDTEYEAPNIRFETAKAYVSGFASIGGSVGALEILGYILTHYITK